MREGDRDKKVILVAIDPGLDTGVAIFHDDDSCISFTTRAPHDRLRTFLERLDESTEVVCEKGPTNHRRQAAACAPVEAQVSELPNTIHWVRPTDWKPHPRAVLLPSDEPGTKHERDVTRMGRWFLARRGAPLASAQAAA